MGSSKKIMSGVVWSVITNIVNALYGFIMIPILINYFGKAEYGLIGLAQSINAYMRLMDMGLTSTNVRFFSNWLAKGDDEKVRKLFSTCTSFYGVIGLINALVLIVIFFFSDSIFNVTPEQDSIMKNLLLILAVSAFVNWFTSCYNQIIQATENVAWTQKQVLVTKILLVVVLGITVIFKLSITAYVILTVLCVWVILPAVIMKIRMVAPMVSFVPRFDKFVFREILPYTLNIFSFSFFSFSYNQLKPVFLGMQSTPESVADFKIIMGIAGIINSVSGIFLSALLPSSSKVIASKDNDKYYMIAYQGTKYIMIFVSFCVFGILCIDRDLLILYVGESYEYLVVWLDISIILFLSNHILGISSLILGGSDIRPLSRMTAVSSTVALIIAWILIPYYDVGGVVIASIVYSAGQMSFYYLYYLPQKMGISSWRILKTIVAPVSIYGTAICCLISQIPPTDSHWLTIAERGVLFAMLYAAGTWFYLNRQDKQYLHQMLFSKRFMK